VYKDCYGLSVSQLLERACNSSPAQEVVWDGYRRMTYGELWSESRALAASLQNMGIEKGDRVAVCLPNWHEFLVMYAAIAHLGAILVPCNTRYRAEEVGANVVLFGHSHVPLCTEERGVLFLNPGSLQLPRGYHQPTYACLEQLAHTDQQVEVDVRFFNHRGEPVSDLGGRFTLRR